MKKLLLSSLAGLILTTGSALAADLYTPPPVYKAAPPPPPAISWTGCSINGGVGYGMWNQDAYGESDPGLVPETTTFTNGGRGWLGRLGAGCDYQLSNFVVGVFGDYDFMNIKSNGFADVAGAGGTANESDAWYVGGRLGYLVTPSLLSYVDGGYTQTRFDSSSLSETITFPTIPLPVSLAAHTYSGWFIGGGAEYALTMPWIPIRGLFWRTEYRFAEYQAADVPINLNIAPGGAVAAEHISPYVQTVTSGLVWRFNFGGPVAANY
jgi:outer membrane immunogenic protein